MPTGIQSPCCSSGWQPLCVTLCRKDRTVARYFFNIRDGQNIKDTVGTELPDLESVRTEALEATTEIIKGRLLANTDTASWVVQVTDDAGFTVMVLSLSASIHLFDLPSEPVAGE